MNKAQWFYAFMTLAAFLLIIGLAWLFFPQEFLSIVLLACLPLILLAVGFQFITNKRIQSLRTQLLHIISTLEEFDIDEPKKVSFDESSYPLFNELNENVLELVNRIRSNYQANRQFTQNASHELQTPLAIIKGHAEILLNSKNLKEKEIQSLGIILQNTDRLARLNHALILLSKIENNRYSDFEELDIVEVIEGVLINFEDLIQLQEITIDKNYIHPLKVEMSATLAEILFANLFQNAIRYNLEEGFIKIKIEHRSVIIANPGEELKGAPATLFKRFEKQSQVEESLGLGLSIVKSICDLYDIDLKYLHQAGLHQLILKF